MNGETGFMYHEHASGPPIDIIIAIAIVAFVVAYVLL